VPETSIILDLVSGSIRGENRSQELIYKMFAGKMKVVCIRYLKSREDAEDLLQEGFIKIFNLLPQYSGTGSFEGWMRRIFVNLCIDTIRKNKKISFISDDRMEIADPTEKDEVDENNLPDFTPDDVLLAMETLTPVYRTVFNLIAFEDYSHQEVADKLGISIGTSKSNYFKAKKNIQRILINKNTQEK
jgi:RNA polymerase sigma-70 factor (ECF subfamily)